MNNPDVRSEHAGVISLIAALARNRVIGKGNRLLWHLPGDLAHFRETTRGKTVVMGRKTWESLPENFRPLPGRVNVVLSRNPDDPCVLSGARMKGSLREAIMGTAEEIFIIGGATVYHQALPFAQRLHLTEIAAEFSGDAFFPEIDPREWKEVSRSRDFNESGLIYSFAIYHRIDNSET